MKKISEQKYPAYFPEGCPPEDASVDEKVLFRFCKNDEPGEDDFVSYFLDNPKKFKGNMIAYGLSVLPSREECREAYKKYPYIRKYRSIAEGKTNENRGSWKTTPGRISPEHITWWVCEDINPCTFFVFDSKIGDEDE